MAGPRIMTLGPFQFQAQGFSFNARTRSLQTPWAEIETARGMNPLQWTGPKSATQTIRGVLFDEFGGQTALEGIKISAQMGVPLPLIDLGGAPLNVFGLYVTEGVDEDHGYITRDSIPLKNSYSIRLRKYPGALASAGGFSVLSLFT